MIKTADVVKKLFLRSDTAQLAATEGVLNVSAFARQIQSQVEELTMKSVSVPTITIALYRLLEQYSLKKFKPVVKLTELSIHSHVIALTYERNQALLKKLPAVMADLNATSHPFYTLTQGPTEVTLIAETNLQAPLHRQLGQPIAEYQQLVAISVKFGIEYLEIPNMIYSLFASLAVRRINVLEIVSTLTSITFVVHHTELNRTLAALKPHLP